jgi:hypothetical protein
MFAPRLRGSPPHLHVVWLLHRHFVAFAYQGQQDNKVRFRRWRDFKAPSAALSTTAPYIIEFSETERISHRKGKMALGY